MSKEELATLIEDAMTKLQMGFSGGDPENLAEELLPAIPKAHQHDVMPSFWTMLRELESKVMNIPARRSDMQFEHDGARLLYKEGHRDARHDAVELILEFAHKLEESLK